MKTIVISLLALGWIDILNPTGISFMVILLSSVRKKWHALLFAIFSYIAFATGGIAIFFGIDAFLKKIYIHLCETYPMQAATAKLVIGVGCVIGFVLMSRYLIRAAREKRELSLQDIMPLKSVSPWFIIGFAIISTWSELFSCVNLIAFAGILSSQNVSIYEASIWMFLFSAFMLVPTIAIYILSIIITNEKFQRIMTIATKAATYFCFYCIPIIFAIGAFWGIKEGIQILI